MERPGTSRACARRGRSRGAKPSCLSQNDELVLLQRYATETQVDILQGALLSAGIFARSGTNRGIGIDSSSQHPPSPITAFIKSHPRNFDVRTENYIHHCSEVL